MREGPTACGTWCRTRTRTCGCRRRWTATRRSRRRRRCTPCSTAARCRWSSASPSTTASRCSPSARRWWTRCASRRTRRRWSSTCTKRARRRSGSRYLLDQGIDLGRKAAVVCWVEFLLKEGSSTKAISGDGERHHLALWRADAHGAMEAGMISENRYVPFTPVSRDAPSLDRLTGWHMPRSSARRRGAPRARRGGRLYLGGRPRRAHLPLRRRRQVGHGVDRRLRAWRSAARRRDPGGGQTAARVPFVAHDGRGLHDGADDKQVAARFLSAQACRAAAAR